MRPSAPLWRCCARPIWSSDNRILINTVLSGARACRLGAVADRNDAVKRIASPARKRQAAETMEMIERALAGKERLRKTWWLA